MGGSLLAHPRGGAAGFLRETGMAIIVPPCGRAHSPLDGVLSLPHSPHAASQWRAS